MAHLHHGNPAHHHRVILFIEWMNSFTR